MRRIGMRAAQVAVLGGGMLLGGCTWFDSATTGMTDGISRAGERIGAPWGGSRPLPQQGSTTIARLTGAPVQMAPLRTEDGDVWPVPEGPRSTLANPDAAMRNIPEYRPGDYERPRGNLPPGLTGTSSPPPPPRQLPNEPVPRSTAPALPNVNAPPPRSLEGQVIQTPQGPAVLGPGTDRVRSYTIPGGGTGTAVFDGNNATLTNPGAPTQVVPAPR